MKRGRLWIRSPRGDIRLRRVMCGPLHYRTAGIPLVRRGRRRLSRQPACDVPATSRDHASARSDANCRAVGAQAVGSARKVPARRPEWGPSASRLRFAPRRSCGAVVHWQRPWRPLNWTCATLEFQWVLGRCRLGPERHESALPPPFRRRLRRAGGRSPSRPGSSGFNR